MRIFKINLNPVTKCWFLAIVSFDHGSENLEHTFEKTALQLSSQQPSLTFRSEAQSTKLVNWNVPQLSGTFRDARGSNELAGGMKTKIKGHNGTQNQPNTRNLGNKMHRGMPTVHLLAIRIKFLRLLLASSGVLRASTRVSQPVPSSARAHHTPGECRTASERTRKWPHRSPCIAQATIRPCRAAIDMGARGSAHRASVMHVDPVPHHQRARSQCSKPAAHAGIA